MDTFRQKRVCKLSYWGNGGGGGNHGELVEVTAQTMATTRWGLMKVIGSAYASGASTRWFDSLWASCLYFWQSCRFVYSMKWEFILIASRWFSTAGFRLHFLLCSNLVLSQGETGIGRKRARERKRGLLHHLLVSIITSVGLELNIILKID